MARNIPALARNPRATVSRQLGGRASGGKLDSAVFPQLGRSSAGWVAADPDCLHCAACSCLSARAGMSCRGSGPSLGRRRCLALLHAGGPCAARDGLLQERPALPARSAAGVAWVSAVLQDSGCPVLLPPAWGHGGAASPDCPSLPEPRSSPEAACLFAVLGSATLHRGSPARGAQKAWSRAVCPGRDPRGALPGRVHACRELRVGDGRGDGELMGF